MLPPNPLHRDLVCPVQTHYRVILQWEADQMNWVPVHYSPLQCYWANLPSDRVSRWPLMKPQVSQAQSIVIGPQLPSCSHLMDWISFDQPHIQRLHSLRRVCWVDPQRCLWRKGEYFDRTKRGVHADFRGWTRSQIRTITDRNELAALDGRSLSESSGCLKTWNDEGVCRHNVHWLRVGIDAKKYCISIL